MELVAIPSSPGRRRRTCSTSPTTCGSTPSNSQALRRWSLTTSVRDWAHAVDEGRRVGTSFDHPERGHMTIDDIVLGNAHDALHHLWDIRRTMHRAANWVG